jgi:hypothetical protein
MDGQMIEIPMVVDMCRSTVYIHLNKNVGEMKKAKEIWGFGKGFGPLAPDYGV